MKVLIDIPQDHKRVIDKLVVDGKDYLLPYEVVNRLAKSVKIGKVILDNATIGDRLTTAFPNEPIEYSYSRLCNNEFMNVGDLFRVDLDTWNAPYKESERVNESQSDFLSSN